LYSSFFFFGNHATGGGSREKVFWHNYFFHCAFTRYEAGLSIDEIWSYQPEEAPKPEGGLVHAVSGDASAEEETVVFDGTTTTGEGEESSAGSAAFPSTDGTNAATLAAAAAKVGGDPDSPSGSGGSSGDYVDYTAGSSYGGGTTGSGTNDSSVLTDFELVDDGDNENAVDAEMDELEAEIAQALGD
jgi:hypothetical protein